MSGVLKGAKKVFKKVGKVVKKVAPYALAVGSVVFTAGAALGVPAMAGGWGAAVTKGLGALGISGSSGLAGALTGAVTQAGYGAALGGIGSAVSGGDFGDGAAMGALAGAATGGVMGGLGMPVDPLSGIGEGGGSNALSIGKTAPAGTPAAAPAQTGLGAPAATSATGAGYTAAAGTPGMAAAPAATTAAGAGAQAGQTGLMSSVMNNPITGHVVKGLGTALLNSGQTDPYKAREAERRDVAASYDLPEGTAGLLPAPGAGQLNQPAELYMTGRRAARAQAERNAPQTATRKAAYQFDPATGTIVFA